MVGPDYHRPRVEIPARFKEARPLPGWQTASPANADMPKGRWWTIYDDTVLDGLEDELDRSNQSLRAALASYDQSTALVDEARSSLYPVLGLTPSVQRSGSGGRGVVVGTGNSLASGTTGTGTAATSALGSTALGNTALGSTGASTASAGSTASTGALTGVSSGASATSTLTLEGTASWDLDLWGRIRRQVQENVAAAQASAAEVANSRLSLEASLATDYFELRASDSLQTLLDQTVRAYARDLQVVQNQYQAGLGTTPPSTYYQALTQLRTAQADAVQVGVARAQYEHAIAVLTGHAPADLAIAPGALQAYVPFVPAGVPSTLLQRRPDIAQSERAIDEANAAIGVAIAAYYPDITLSASGGWSGSQLSTLVQVANEFWSLGAAASETLFEGGLRSSEVRAAEAAYDGAVADYRQTVLSAFEGVEDELVALRIYADQGDAERLAVDAARKSVTVSFNEYQAGTVDYTTVVTAETTALGDEQTALTVQEDRLVASVALVEALGGGWDTGHLPSRDGLQRNQPLLPAFIDPDRTPAPG